MTPDAVTLLLTRTWLTLDISLPPTPTSVQRAGVLDIAPAPGFDLIVLGVVAVLVAGVLVLILHSRRRR
jgi:hypothetical protein